MHSVLYLHLRVPLDTTGKRYSQKGVPRQILEWLHFFILPTDNSQHFRTAIYIILKILLVKKLLVEHQGSGTAKTLERLAKAAGIWGQFTPIYRGGSPAAQELQDGQVKGFMWLVSVPNSAIIELTAIKSIRMIDLDTPATKHGLYEKYPYYYASLPEGAYEGKVETVRTIMMPTVLIANKAVPDEIIYNIIKHIYSDKGHQEMVQTNKAASDMTIENAEKAFVIPLHNGAFRFWQEKGVEIPKRAMPVEDDKRAMPVEDDI